MKKGGYLIIDFKKYGFSSGQAGSIEGIYEKVLNEYEKATMISGLVVGDVEYPDFYAPFISSGANCSTSVVIGGKTISIVITNEDNVTVTVTE